MNEKDEYGNLFTQMASSSVMAADEFSRMGKKIAALQEELNRINKMVETPYIIEEMEP